MGTHKRLLGLALAVAVVSTLGSYRMATGDTGALKVVPDFTFKDLDGKDVSFYSLKAKAYVIDLWATYCAPCKAEIPHFNELQKKYKSQGLQIIGISLDPDSSVLKPYVEKHPMEYLSLIGNPDVTDKVFGEIELLPDTYFIDGQHRLHASMVSKPAPDAGDSQDAIDKHVKEMLETIDKDVQDLMKGL